MTKIVETKLEEKKVETLTKVGTQDENVASAAETEKLRLKKERAIKALRARALTEEGKLFIPEECKDPDLVYRYVREDENLHNKAKMERIGYDVVHHSDLNADLGDQNLAHADTSNDSVVTVTSGGETLILMATPKELFEEGQKIEREKVQRSEKAITEAKDGLGAGTLSKTLDKNQT